MDKDLYIEIPNTKTYDLIVKGNSGIQRVYIDKPFQVFLTDWESDIEILKDSNLICGIYYIRRTRQFKTSEKEYIELPKPGEVMDPNIYIPVFETTEITIYCSDGDYTTFKPKHLFGYQFQDVIFSNIQPLGAIDYEQT